MIKGSNKKNLPYKLVINGKNAKQLKQKLKAGLVDGYMVEMSSQQ